MLNLLNRHMHSFMLHSGVINSLFRERSLFRAGEGVADIREGLWIFGKSWRRGYGISTFSINLIAFYHICCNLIGYPTRYLFRDR